MKPGRLILLLVVLSLASAEAGKRYRASRADTADRPGDYPEARLNVRAPDTVRIKVEVLNASAVRGLARRAATYLRDRGFDVVHIGTSSTRSDTTVVLDRSGNLEWAKLVATAMGGTAASLPDSSRYLDVTVLVGAGWRPPPRPLYP